jgi:hypothetical protein
VKHSLLLEIFTDEGIGTQMIHERRPVVTYETPSQIESSP